jgi:hypothetical protein
LNEAGVLHPVAALAHRTIGGKELVLLVLVDAFDTPGDDMDAWVRLVVDGERGGRELADPPDELVDQAWGEFEEILTLTFSGDAP